jgi:sulfur carrier protein ThiS
VTICPEEGSTVSDLLALTGINDEDIGLIIVNGRQVSHNYLLAETDQVQLFSPLSGG